MGLLSPPFEAQIIQSLAAKKATFMPHCHSAAPLLRPVDFYGVRQRTLLDQTFAALLIKTFRHSTLALAVLGFSTSWHWHWQTSRAEALLIKLSGTSTVDAQLAQLTAEAVLLIKFQHLPPSASCPQQLRPTDSIKN